MWFTGPGWPVFPSLFEELLHRLPCDSCLLGSCKSVDRVRLTVMTDTFTHQRLRRIVCIISFIYLFCVFACVHCVYTRSYATGYKRRAEDNLQEQIFSKDQTQVIRLGCKHHNPWSHPSALSDLFPDASTQALRGRALARGIGPYTPLTIDLCFTTSSI